MNETQHSGNNLKYLTIVPEDYRPELRYPLVVMLHGFGSNMADLAKLAPAINSQGYVYACPNAPIQFDLGQGRMGFGWTSIRGQATTQEILDAENLLAGCIDDILNCLSLRTSQVLLLGFSQGGIMTYRYGLAHPEMFAGLAVLSAPLPDLKELESKLPKVRMQPMFVAQGLYDSIVPVESGQATLSFLEEMGYRPKYQEYSMGHEITSEVLDDLAAWMGEVLPPLEVQL